MIVDDAKQYDYHDHQLGHHHLYLLPPVERILNGLTFPQEKRRLFELGCGNGSVANYLTQKGFEVTGVDPSEAGIKQAAAQFPGITLRQGSAYDDLAAVYGRFPALISLEVVEHVYFPRKYAKCVYDLLDDDGVAIISTPYHGYAKNLALALMGKLDAHFTALWDHGHIKFWSPQTLKQLLNEAGFQDVRFLRVGRISVLAKSMIAVASKKKSPTLLKYS